MRMGLALRQSRSGMTLIELMVVIVILGIVSAMILPSFGGSMDSVRLTGAARDLASTMDFAYRSAIASGRVHALTIDADRKRFELLAERPPEPAAADAFGADAPLDRAPELLADPLAEPELVPVPIPGYIPRELPEGIRVGMIAVVDRELSTTGDGNARLLFFPDGTAEYASLGLTNESGDQCVVTLDGLTGMIDVGQVEPQTAAQDADANADAGDGGA
jgi:type II secretion system protein H